MRGRCRRNKRSGAVSAACRGRPAACESSRHRRLTRYLGSPVRSERRTRNREAKHQGPALLLVAGDRRSESAPLACGSSRRAPGSRSGRSTVPPFPRATSGWHVVPSATNNTPRRIVGHPSAGAGLAVLTVPSASLPCFPYDSVVAVPRKRWISVNTRRGATGLAR